MPSRRCSGVAESQCGSPSKCLGTCVRCGARITHPVCPVQLSGSSEASFSGKYGSPALPKILSTKSRLDTSPPGTKKRVSMYFAVVNPGTAGTTKGRKSRDTKPPARPPSPRRERQLQGFGGRIQGQIEQFGKGDFRYRQFVVWNRQPAVGHVEDTRRRPADIGPGVQYTIAQTIAAEQR